MSSALIRRKKKWGSREMYPGRTLVKRKTEVRLMLLKSKNAKDCQRHGGLEDSLGAQSSSQASNPPDAGISDFLSPIL